MRRRALIAAAATAGVALAALAAGLLLAPGDAEFSVSAVPDLVLGPAEASSDVTGSPSGIATATAAPRGATPVLASDFDSGAAMRHIAHLATTIGPRPAGSDADVRTVSYVRGELERLGYATRTETVPLPGGATTRNVIAERQGALGDLLLIGAHMDTKAGTGSPGGNDNASGVGVVLALAQALAEETPTVTVQFVLFGAEEMQDTNADHHHYGSRYRAAHLTDAERARLVGMISVDMVGVGDRLQVVTMGSGPRTLADDILAVSKAISIRAAYRKDTSRYGFSDHEPFERAGYAVACIHRVDDPAYHTPQDTAEHVDSAAVRTAGRLVLSYVRALDPVRLAGLR